MAFKITNNDGRQGPAWLAEYETGPFNTKFNFNVERALGSGSAFEFGYGWIASFEVFHDARLAVEAFGEFGEIGDFGALKTREHYIGPVALFEIESGLPGELEIESTPGQGTTVRLRLPTAGGPRAGGARPTPAAARQRRILLVDDDRAVRETLVQALERDRYLVRATGDVGEAVAFLGRDPVDLVVTDLVLPGGSGLEVARTAKRARATLPVILVTGWPGRVDAQTLGVAEHGTDDQDALQVQGREIALPFLLALGQPGCIDLLVCAVGRHAAQYAQAGDVGDRLDIKNQYRRNHAGMLPEPLTEGPHV